MQNRLDRHDGRNIEGQGEQRGSGLSSRARISLAVGVLVSGYVLLQLGGGFPPQAWKVLFFALTGQAQTGGQLNRALLQGVILVIAWLLLVLVAIQTIRPGFSHLDYLQEKEEGHIPDLAQVSRENPSTDQAQAWQPSREREHSGHFQGNREQPAPSSAASSFGSMPFPEFPNEGEDASNPTEQFPQASIDPLKAAPPLISGPSTGRGHEDHSSEEHISNPRTKMGLTTRIDTVEAAEALKKAERAIATPSSQSSPIGMRTIPALFTTLSEASHSEPAQSTFHIAPDDFLPPESRAGIEFIGWSLCHKGNAVEREALEDTVLVAAGNRPALRPPTPFAFFILADGIATASGQTTGKLVSSVLTEALLSVLWGANLLDQEGVKTLLTNGVQYANRILFQYNEKQHARKIATLSVVLILGPIAYIANVGDNRVYFYRAKEGFVQVTYDHSSTEQQLEQGKITPEQVFKLTKESQVYRTLGQQATVKVDVFALTLQPKDLLLMCTDGVWKVIRKTTLHQLVEQLAGPPNADPSLLCPAIVRNALAGGGYDRVSALAVLTRSSSSSSRESLSTENKGETV